MYTHNRMNPFFMFPFLIWCIGGSILLWVAKADALFFWVNAHNTAWADTLFPMCTLLGEFGGIITLGVLLMLLFPLYRNPAFFITAVLGTVFPAIVSQLIKHSVAAPRPMQVFRDHSLIHRLEDWQLLYQNSFPSGHTTGAFAFMTVVAFWLPGKYRAWGLLCFLLAFAAAYSRVYLTAHFFADVYAGSIIGTLMAWIICVQIPPLLAKWRKRPQNEQ